MLYLLLKFCELLVNAHILGHGIAVDSGIAFRIALTHVNNANNGLRALNRYRGIEAIG